jgi:1-deoxy-D-xylulose-5-phosphate reductoisomerase
MSPRRITVLGATGSIGASTLDVIARHPDRYRAVALSAFSDDARLFELCQAHRPRYAVLVDHAAAQRLHTSLRATGLDIEVLAGTEALCEIARLPDCDTVMAAIVGSAGLAPTLAAVRAGKRVLLANKEALVMSGDLFMHEVRTHDAMLLPIDSEHNAVFQCLPRGLDTANSGITRVLLTASGGPFRTTALDRLDQVTPDEACAHPNWRMGRKISVDSATMMNKGLEVIEACHLFALRPEQVEVVIHPQSVIHSLVEYLDGSLLAQLGAPDMRIPIAHALAWPERIASGAARLDLTQIAHLDFHTPEPARYPCLALAHDALVAGGTAPTILNAANEVAVAAFLDGRLVFTGITALIADTLAALPPQRAGTLDDVLAADSAARRIATGLLAQPRRVRAR